MPPQKRYATSPLIQALVPNAAGFLYIDRQKFHAVFAQDVSTAEALVMAATQKPIASVAFEQAVDNVAWKTIPSWYLVSQEDQAIPLEHTAFYGRTHRCQNDRDRSEPCSFYFSSQAPH